MPSGRGRHGPEGVQGHQVFIDNNSDHGAFLMCVGVDTRDGVDAKFSVNLVGVDVWLLESVSTPFLCCTFCTMVYVCSAVFRGRRSGISIFRSSAMTHKSHYFTQNKPHYWHYFIVIRLL